jgi:HK97 family phage portal protein
MGLFTRAIRPPADEIPNGNDPVTAAPGTVGPPDARPGDPHGVLLAGDPAPAWIPPRIVPSAWSGWPAEWWPPYWNGLSPSSLGETAWICIDLNASVLSTMPAYLVDAPPTLDAAWLRNPEPEIYTSWEEFAKQLFWDYQAVGEAFVLATARYSTGWPARFHVLPPWTVDVEMDAGFRRYRVGEEDVTADVLHIRYQSSVSDAHGHGPLEVGGARQVAAEVLLRYATSLVSNGGIPPSVLMHPEELTQDQADLLKAQWVAARLSSIGEPAVLSGGVTWEAVQLDPEKMSLVDLSKHNESRIAVMLGVPPFLVGLPSGGDSMTYANVSAIFDYHWRAGLKPKAAAIMAALSEWLLPRGTRVELNRDEYVQPGPLERAQADQIWAAIIDPATGQQAKTVAEIRAQERLEDPTPALAEGVLR